MKPARIQLSRKKGFNLQEHSLSVNGLPAVKVDRSTKWGNPFAIGAGPMLRHALDHEGAVGFFRQMMSDPQLREEAGYPNDLSPLRGKNLGCWCKPGAACHADVLLELANR